MYSEFRKLTQHCCSVLSYGAVIIDHHNAVGFSRGKDGDIYRCPSAVIEAVPVGGADLGSGAEGRDSGINSCTHRRRRASSCFAIKTARVWPEPEGQLTVAEFCVLLEKLTTEAWVSRIPTRWSSSPPLTSSTPVAK